MWSDLFLASGAVINFNNGDVTATHAANALAFAGASSGYTFDAGVGIGTTSVAAERAAGYRVPPATGPSRRRRMDEHGARCDLEPCHGPRGVQHHGCQAAVL